MLAYLTFFLVHLPALVMMFVAWHDKKIRYFAYLWLAATLLYTATYASLNTLYFGLMAVSVFFIKYLQQTESFYQGLVRIKTRNVANDKKGMVAFDYGTLQFDYLNETGQPEKQVVEVKKFYFDNNQKAFIEGVAEGIIKTYNVENIIGKVSDLSTGETVNLGR